MRPQEFRKHPSNPGCPQTAHQAYLLSDQHLEKKEYIKSVSYANDTAADQEYTCQYSRSVKKSTTWSTTSKIEFTVSTSVTAGIPEVALVSAGYSLTVGAEQTSSMTQEETKTESDAVKVKVPAGKKASVEVSVGRANIDLPYSATVKITCKNGSKLVFPSTGQYNVRRLGLRYIRGFSPAKIHRSNQRTSSEQREG
ncbi:Aerolysin-like protein [Merluccius polli]|uniref:Aerolysin-like protein n=1 Tax=Merluccius polli TaxID=89951 RepID=A0AA47P5N8_MERPO|nr:Aerolysin-like protein [Merluccius polli]